MNRVFQARDYLTAPDGTDVSPFLNATDPTQNNVPWGALGEMSIASGRIGPKVYSWVPFHPVVTQVTYLLAGELTVRMKDASAIDSYDLRLQVGQAALLEPRTLFQLRNDGNAPAEILYMVSPQYVFEMDAGKVRYNDANLVAKTWEELVASGYNVPALEMTFYEGHAARDESIRRLAVRKGRGPKVVADSVCTLRSKYDYLAPDGSEIRLLASGERGGLAHCVLPAGKTSAPVRHRTVEELWYVLEGAGQVWRERAPEPGRVDAVHAGDSIRIQVGTAFQFRAEPDTDLKLLLATMPPWPGAQEAVTATGGLA